MNDGKQFTESKKMIAFGIAIVAVFGVGFVGSWLGLDSDSQKQLLDTILGLAGMAIGGQAAIDFMSKISGIFQKKDKPTEPK